MHTAAIAYEFNMIASTDTAATFWLVVARACSLVAAFAVTLDFFVRPAYTVYIQESDE